MSGAVRSTERAPDLPDPQQVKSRIAHDVAWSRSTLVRAYEVSGQDGKCASAKEALTAVADLWSRNPQRAGNEQERAWRASHKAVSAGCDEPLVLFVHAVTYKSAALESLDEAVRLHREAAS